MNYFVKKMKILHFFEYAFGNLFCIMIFITILYEEEYVMNQRIKKILCVLSLIAICISSLPRSVVFADTNSTDTSIQFDISSCYSDEIIGGPNDSETSTYSLPNWLVLDWDATENGIYLYFTNVGVDSIDVVSGTISTGNTTKSFSYNTVTLGTHTYYISLPIKTCSESITINYYATDGGDSIGASTSYGSRAISSTLINMWTTGSQDSRVACLNYHYRVHGTEVGALNIAAYVRLADLVRNNIISEGLSPIRTVSGTTANVYRYEWSTFYLHVVNQMGLPTWDLVSFGLAW